MKKYAICLLLLTSASFTQENNAKKTTVIRFFNHLTSSCMETTVNTTSIFVGFYGCFSIYSQALIVDDLPSINLEQLSVEDINKLSPELQKNINEYLSDPKHTKEYKKAFKAYLRTDGTNTSNPNFYDKLESINTKTRKTKLIQRCQIELIQKQFAQCRTALLGKVAKSFTVVCGLQIIIKPTYYWLKNLIQTKYKKTL